MSVIVLFIFEVGSVGSDGSEWSGNSHVSRVAISDLHVVNMLVPRLRHDKIEKRPMNC